MFSLALSAFSLKRSAVPAENEPIQINPEQLTFPCTQNGLRTGSPDSHGPPDSRKK
jgi:hypothetical protein